MGEELTDFFAARGPAPGRPLLGLTVLVVEDSRFACEAMRLLCLRSGARIRRADCLRSARRHLQTYRPTVAIVDLGLPDGSGLELIGELARMNPRMPAILGTSGDAAAEAFALAAGADGFLPKPVERLAEFQRILLAALKAVPPAAARGAAEEEPIAPDPLALRDDLAHAADLLGTAADDGAFAYIAQFLSGIARSAHDVALADAARTLARDRRAGVPQLARMVSDRLAAGACF